MTARACADREALTGDRLVALARTWIGTPYLHQASVRGAGADCLGLIRGIWREVYGAEPEPVPPYAPNWSEMGRAERLLEAASRHLEPVAVGLALPGDVLALRMVDRGVAKHIGLLACAPQGHATLVHAYSGHGVVESPLTPAWRRRVAAAFRFPGRT